MTSDRIIPTVIFDTVVAFDIIVAFVIPLVAPLMLSPVMWRKEHLWNFSVLLQRVQLSNLVPVKLVKLDCVSSSLISYASLCFTMSTLVNSSFFFGLFLAFRR
jgi:hypothetical protein